MALRAIKPALLQIHSVVGLAFALILCAIGLSGATMSFEDEIVAALNATIMRVQPRAPAPKLTPDELVTRLRAHSDAKVSVVTMASDAAAAARLRFARSADGARPVSVYVDPYDGRVLGSPRGEEFFATVRKLHRWLLIPGDGKGYGRQATGFAALALIAMLVTGLVLRRPRRALSVKAWLKPNLRLHGRGFHLSLHRVAGTWLLPVYLVSALTGLWYSFDWYKDGAVWLLSRPAAAATPAPMQGQGQPKQAQQRPAESDRPLAFDRVWSAFLQDQGGRYATAQLALPPDGTLVRIRSWAREAHEGARDEFRIDALTGRVAARDIYAERPFGERVLASVLDIHRGGILGWPGRVVFMLAAALMPLFAWTGLMLYLSRRRLRRLCARAPVTKAMPALSDAPTRI